ncbi:MAG: efflux RND transporter periplasmic adaptor subunit [Alteromonadaceae bacterium]|nr:efflux RND transporter periplasmic adaptor subunit [Alteromonadaceae bacterium]
MDTKRVINKKAWWQKPKALFSFLLIMLFTALYFYSQKFSSADLQVNSDHLLFAQVKQGPMTVSVSGNGSLVPENIQWLAARVAGRVEQVLVKAGTGVKQGDVIALLSNPELQQQAEESRWEQETLIAQFDALKVNLDSNLLQQEAQVLKALFSYETASLHLEAETQLINNNTSVVSQIDYKKTQMNVTQLKQTWKIQQKLYDKLSLNMQAQIKAKNAQLNKLSKILQRAEERIASLSIMAPMDGIVQESDLKPGQQISEGGLIAKIADPKSLFAEVQLSELSIGDVVLGQPATIDTRNGIVRGEVIRIDPNVIEGNVQVDIKIIEALPRNARPDLSITAKINVSELTDTLYIQRPAFVRANASSSLYRVDQEGYARKVIVQLGQG